MGSKNRRWVFTLNNYTAEDELKISDFCESDRCVYGIVGREVGEGGTPHLQGFLILSSPQRLSFLRTNVSGRAHYEVARGTSQEASDYCEKDNDFSTYGTLPDNQGGRTDIDRFKEWVTNAESRPSQREIAREFPGLFLRYPRLVELVEHLRPQPDLVGPDEQLRDWQINLNNMLVEDPDDRTINFIVDEAGGQGKSWFVRYMLSKQPDLVQVLSIGKRDDIAYAIDDTKSIFLFDIPRRSMEFFQYSIVEKLKDRLVFSAKYASKIKILEEQVHVCVFCNERPDMYAMTGDRYNIIDI